MPSIQSDKATRRKLDLLLRKGFFPSELPYCFQTSEFADHAPTILAAWNKTWDQAPKTLYDKYSIPRAGLRRRILGVVNPVSQAYLAREIVENWSKIQSHLKKSQYSTFVPEIARSRDRAVSSFDFDQLGDEQSKILGSYSRALQSDISRFYPSLYTHSIAWALHGKLWCKRNMHTALKTALGNRLDSLVRKCQDQQSIGIPLGPDTSRIIAELLGVSVDIGLSRRFKPCVGRYVRNVDDIFIGLSEEQSADQAFSVVSNVIQQFDLAPNHEKTGEVDASFEVHSRWVRELRQLELSTDPFSQETSIRDFFTHAFAIAERHPNENVLRYAIKKAGRVVILPENWPIFQHFLLRMARANTTVLDWVCPLIMEAKYYNKPVDQAEVQRFVLDLLDRAIPRGYDYEVAWGLFMALSARIKLPKSICKRLQEYSSAACAVLALDLESRGLATFSNKSNWAVSTTVDGLKSEQWLLAYEAGARGWLPETEAGFISKCNYFSEIRKHGITFYKRRIGVRFVGGRLKQMRERLMLDTY